ncbi:MAG TPA: MFS transporter [Victivallales bacterium]|nr:MFS transporter [Victivallales bacterium]
MNSKRTTFLSSFGAGLEYFDFIIYAMLAGYISQLFFPDADKYVSLIETFGVFAIGYFVRPVGGVIFGMIGDKYGRKITFVIVMLLMSIATASMGFLPTYSSIGVYAALMFMLLRIVQGISFGAELPCALTFITEHAGKRYRSVHCGILISFVTLGIIMGTFTIYLLSAYLSDKEMLAYGWRIPFFIGGGLAIITFFIRFFTKETPLYKDQTDKPNNALWLLLTEYQKQISIGIGIMLLPSVLVMFVMCMPSYFVSAYGYDVKNIYYAITVGYIWSAISLPVFSFISDLITRKALLIFSCLAFIVSGVYLFRMLEDNTFYNLIAFMVLYQTFISAMAACFYPMLAESFPTKVRYTGVAFCYNVTYAVAALTPILVNFVYNLNSESKYVSIILVLIAVVTLISAGVSEDCTGEDLT